MSDPAQAYVRFDINDLAGRKMYQFECASAESAAARRLNFDYSGDFECRIWTDSDPRYRTLFLEEPNADREWQSRARFFASDLQGACARYPDYGRVRTFLLRGMRVEIGLQNIRFGKDKDGPLFKAFDAVIDVQPSEKARSATTQESEYEHPKAGCKAIVRNKGLGRQVTGPYPSVETLTKTLTVGDRPMETLIRNTNRTLAYAFRCESVPLRISDGNKAVNCGLYRPNTQLNLLQDRDPFTQQTRARFTLHQVTPPCSSYPEWGSTRIFKLRGMKLAVRVEDVQPTGQDNGFKTMKLNLHVEPDGTARSAYAQPVNYIDPSVVPLDQSSCKDVLVSH